MSNKHNSNSRSAYGLTQDFTVDPKPGTDKVEIGGFGSNQIAWSRTLTHRAAQQVWFSLTQHLYPEKFEKITSMAQTSIINETQAIDQTRYVEVLRNADTRTCDLIGFEGESQWWCRLDDQSARTLWKRLDEILFPSGWQGNMTYRSKGQSEK